MPGPGYYGGLLAGMQGMTDIQHTQQADAITRAEFPYKMQSLQIKTETEKMNYQNQQLEKQLLAQAFSGAPDNNEQDSANRYFALSRKLAGIDPKASMEYRKEGEDILSKVETRQASQLNQEKAKVELYGVEASTISDQDSLNKALPKLEQLRGPVPDRYKVWNEDTKKFWEKQSQLSADVARQKTVDRTEAKMKLDQRKQDWKEREDKIRDHDRQAKEAQLQNKQKASKMYKEASTDTKATMMKQLESNPDFKELDASDKAQAVEDFGTRAFDLELSGLPASAAKKQAKEEVLGAISKQTEKKYGIWNTDKVSYESPDFPSKSTETAKAEPQPIEVPKDDLKAMVEQVLGSYEPDKFDYRVLEDGTVQKRPK